VTILRNWREMLQATYTPSSIGYRGLPGPHLFVHATGGLKPWRPVRFRLTQEIFPYFDAAQRYLDELEPSERAAFVERSRVAKVWKAALGSFRSYVWLRRTLHQTAPALEWRFRNARESDARSGSLEADSSAVRSSHRRGSSASTRSGSAASLE
jgi:hypothetical protein